MTGAGPAVVLCDGIACDGFIWKYLLPHLARSYRVVHWNYRGHGRSGPPRDAGLVDIAAHARDALAVLADAGLERAAWVGHSMGTQVCLEVYRRDPGAVAGLALLCGSYGRITRTFHGSDVLAQVLPHALRLHARHPQLARALWSRGPVGLSIRLARWMGEVDALRLRPEDLAPYFEHVALLDPEMFLRMLHAAGEHTAEDLLPAVRAPALVVAAGRDTFTPVRYAAQMARQIPGAELLVLPEGSHTAPLEQPELVNHRVESFLVERVHARAPAA